MADVSDYLYCDKKECNLGESITFKVYYPLTYNLGILNYGREGINVYEDNVLIGTWDGDGNYSYTPSTSGTHTIKIEGFNYITVEITVTGGDNGVTWTIGNKEVKSLTINNKIVKSIERVSDNTIIYGETPVYDISLTSDKQFASPNETITFTAIVTQTIENTTIPVVNKIIIFTDGTNILGTTITDSDGIATLQHSWSIEGNLNVKATKWSNESNSINIIIMPSLTIIAEGSTIKEAYAPQTTTKFYGTNMIIDYGDGTTGSPPLNHTYTDGLTQHLVKVYGILSLKSSAFSASNSWIKSVSMDLFIGLGQAAFKNCSNLTSVTISSRTNLNSQIFNNCNNLIDYQLYFVNPPRIWSNTDMPNHTNTIFTIPYGSTANYVAKNFPSNKLVERSP